MASCKNDFLRTLHISDFSEQVTPGLPIEKLKFDLSLFLVKIDQEILFADVLDGKKGFPD